MHMVTSQGDCAGHFLKSKTTLCPVAAGLDVFLQSSVSSIFIVQHIAQLLTYTTVRVDELQPSTWACVWR
jgi:hypothetical protein